MIWVKTFFKASVVIIVANIVVVVVVIVVIIIIIINATTSSSKKKCNYKTNIKHAINDLNHREDIYFLYIIINVSLF